MRNLVLLLATGASLFGQPADSTVTVQASRTIYPQPDQVVFGVYVISGASASLDDVLVMLQDSGVKAENFSNVKDASGPPALQWTFIWSVPLARINDAVKSLGALVRSSAPGELGVPMYAFNVLGVRSSTLQECSPEDILSDARAQGQKLAAAVGHTLGSVRAACDTCDAGLPPAPTFPPNVLLLTGSFSQPGEVIPISRLLRFQYAPPVQPQSVTCTLTVQFALQP
jgi:hypothetical protein